MLIFSSHPICIALHETVKYYSSFILITFFVPSYFCQDSNKDINWKISMEDYISRVRMMLEIERINLP